MKKYVGIEDNTFRGIGGSSSIAGKSNSRKLLLAENAATMTDREELHVEI